MFRQKLSRWMIAGCFAVTSLASFAADAPDKLIERVSTQMIDRIKNDKSLQGGDVQKLNDAVNETVMPYVNFERMTALSVGRNWRNATPEQKQQLMKEFRTLLVHTYAGALSAVRDQSVKMKPLRGDPARLSAGKSR
jgi:phospholipid transport system substrate-binding protein